MNLVTFRYQLCVTIKNHQQDQRIEVMKEVEFTEPIMSMYQYITLNFGEGITRSVQPNHVSLQYDLLTDQKKTYIYLDYRVDTLEYALVVNSLAKAGFKIIGD